MSSLLGWSLLKEPECSLSGFKKTLVWIRGIRIRFQQNAWTRIGIQETRVVDTYFIYRIFSYMLFMILVI